MQSFSCVNHPRKVLIRFNKNNLYWTTASYQHRYKIIQGWRRCSNHRNKHGSIGKRKYRHHHWRRHWFACSLNRTNSVTSPTNFLKKIGKRTTSIWIYSSTSFDKYRLCKEHILFLHALTGFDTTSPLFNKENFWLWQCLTNIPISLTWLKYFKQKYVCQIHYFRTESVFC